MKQNCVKKIIKKHVCGECPSVPPNIVGENTPQDVSVLQNRQATLECKSDAVPPPTLTWLKDGQQLQVSRPIKRENRQQSAVITSSLYFETIIFPLHRPLHVYAFFRGVATYRSTYQSSATQLSTHVWQATLLGRPHESLT